MAKKKRPEESSAVYFLKILLYVLLGAFVIDINGHALIPAGLIIGLVFSSHEHFQIDRKVEYALLIVSCLIAFIIIGIHLNIPIN